MLPKKESGHFDSVLLLSLSTAVFFGIIAYVERLLALKPPQAGCRVDVRKRWLIGYQRSLAEIGMTHAAAVAAIIPAAYKLMWLRRHRCLRHTVCVARPRRQTVGGFSAYASSSERVDPLAVPARCTTEFTTKAYKEDSSYNLTDSAITITGSASRDCVVWAAICRRSVAHHG